MVSIRITNGTNIFTKKLLTRRFLIGGTIFVAVVATSFFAAQTNINAASSEIFISATGSDTASGSLNAPVASISRALELVGDGGSIRMRSGKYPKQLISSDVQNVKVIGDSGVSIAGMGLTGASGITFSGLNFTATVNMENKGNLTNVTNRITLDNVDVSSNYAGACVRIINASNNITVINSRLHHCNFGVQGPGRASRDYSSHDLLIKNNVIEYIVEDGMQFGFWYNVKIENNKIRQIALGVPETEKHADGIQITGSASNVAITNNRIGPVRSQAMILQSDLGAVDDVRVAGNIIGPSYAVAFRLLGVTHAVVDSNVSCGRLGGLWVQPHSKNPVVTDTVITNNTFRGEDVPLSQVLRIYDGAKAATNTNNVTKVGECSDLIIDATPSITPTVTVKPTIVPTPSATTVMSPTPTPTATTPAAGKPADLNKDGKVNAIDLSILLSNWGTSFSQADISGNNIVDVFDLSILISSWDK